MVVKKKTNSVKKKKELTKKKAIVKKPTIVSKSSTDIKHKDSSCVYSHADVDRLLDSTPKFSKFYHWMTFLVYIGIMAIVWGVVYYAYSIDKPIYDLFCVNCGKFTVNVVKVVITAWLFALYFYFLCELRCRAWDMCIFTSESSVRKTNKWISALSVLFTGLTSVFFWF